MMIEVFVEFNLHKAFNEQKLPIMVDSRPILHKKVPIILFLNYDNIIIK